MTEHPAEIQLVSSELGSTLVAVPLSQVELIEDPPADTADAAADGPEEALCDVARLLGVTSPVERHRRRVLVVRREGAALRLLVGSSTAVAEVARTDLHQLPELIAGFAARAAISGIFMLQGRIGLVLDPQGLAALQARGEQP